MLLKYHNVGAPDKKNNKSGVIALVRICRPYITRKDGVRVYAKDLGLKAICWEVTEEENRAYWEKRKAKEAKKKAKEEEKQQAEDIDKEQSSDDADGIK
jgi:hypothetical protein